MVCHSGTDIALLGIDVTNYLFGDRPMTRTKSTFLALVAVLLSPMAANADLIDFEDLNVGDVVTDQYANDGVIFDSDGLEIWDFVSLRVCPSDVDLCIGDLRFHFVDPNDGATAASTDFLSFEIGDTGGDLDEWFIHIFDSNLVELENRYIASNDFITQAFNYSDIGSVWIDWATPIVSGYVFDNLEFNTPTSVPEPGTLALLGIGLLGMGAARRKKKA